jgi:hypothetical protein
VVKVPSASKSARHHSINRESRNQTEPVLIRDLVVTNSKYVWHCKSKCKKVVCVFVLKLREQQTQTDAVRKGLEVERKSPVAKAVAKAEYSVSALSRGTRF